MKPYKIKMGIPAALYVDLSPQIKVPWRKLRPLVAFASSYCRRIAMHQFKGAELPACLHLKITKGNSWRGRAFPRSRRCLVRIGSQEVKPFLSVYPRYKEMPTFWISNWDERLIGLVTHELWHLYNPGHGKKYEYDCELMELDSIESWRVYKGYTFTPPQEADEQAA